MSCFSSFVCVCFLCFTHSLIFLSHFCKPTSLPFGVNLFPQNEPSSEAVASVSKIVDTINSKSSTSDSNASTNMEPPQSLCGRVINVVIWEPNHWDLIKNAKLFVGVGKFLHLRNVKDVSMFE